MPFALVFIGLLLIVTGAKDTYREFGAEITEDFTGAGNFTYWVVAIGVLGAIGYVKAFQSFSRLFLVLVLVAMTLSNRGVFAQLTNALQTGPTTPKTEPAAQTTNTAQSVAIPPLPANQNNNSNAQENFGKVLQVVKLFVGL